MNNTRCMYCHKIIPEERTICPLCEYEQLKLSMILQSSSATKEEVKAAYDFMEGNNDD